MWFYYVNKQKLGPVDEDEIKRLISTHVITPDTLLWTKGMPQWEKANKTIFASSFVYVKPKQLQQQHVVKDGAYKISFSQVAPDHKPFTPALLPENSLPAVITKTNVISNGVQVHISNAYLERISSALKQTNLFKDVGASANNFLLDNFQGHTISLSAVEVTHNNTARWFLFIFSVIMLPLLLIYLLIKFQIRFSQQIIIEVTAANGEKLMFKAETSGMTKIGFFANAIKPMLYLQNQITEMNINSLMNQIIKNKDTLGL